MGVRGLTTYLKENRHKLSYTLELKSKDLIAHDGPVVEDNINVIVDGWSLIYAVLNYSGEPWVYGGEPAALAQHVGNIVIAWKRAGIRPTIVFDGPPSSLKYPTVVSRSQNNCVNHANVFFRTSAAARSTPRSLSETRIAPPCCYVAIVSTLLSMSDDVAVEIAEGEADPYIVSLAGRLGAYVVGNDSDFIVLNSEGYKGYIPLDEMSWCTSAQSEGVRSPDSASIDGEDSGFQTVTKKKQKGKNKMKESRVELGTGPIPPSSDVQSVLSLVLTVYEPTTLAKHLSLPSALLPLLGALVGNDFASINFFRITESAINRIQRVADTLSSVLKEAQSGNAKKIRKIDRGGQGSVMDVIGTTIERLLLWRDPGYPPASGEIDKITETVVQGTLEYTVDGPALLFPNDDEAENTDSHFTQVRSLYLDAYHRGMMHPRLMEVFARGACFPKLFLEDPDRECCARSIGRSVREMIWKIFVSGGGIPITPEPGANGTQLINDGTLEDEEDEEEDEDELVDVMEELSDDEASVIDDDDPLAALRGKLQRLSFSGAGSEAPEAAGLSSQPETVSHTPTGSVETPPPPSPPPLQPRVVTEYVRRGARVVPEDIEVTGLEDVPWDYREDHTPVQLRPIQERLTVFLKVLGSDTPHVRAMAAEECGVKDPMLRGSKLLMVVTIRWVLQTLHGRAEGLEDGNRKRDRIKEKWTRSEVEAFLSSLTEEETIEQPSIDVRAIQLTAQVLSALEAIEWLAEALLLVNVPNARQDDRGNTLPLFVGETEKMFSGRRFHTALAQRKRGIGKSFEQLWQASTEGLETILENEKGKKTRITRKEKSDTRPNPHRMANGQLGMFGALADLNE